jgi:hypothetical protein
MKNYQDSLFVSVQPEKVFAFIDNHQQFSSHMSQSSWMMGGGKMKIITDAEKGRGVGSHIILEGRVWGINLFVDEVITAYTPPRLKAWETVGKPRLLIIGHYKMTVKVKPDSRGSKVTIAIDYDLPEKMSGWGNCLPAFTPTGASGKC